MTADGFKRGMLVLEAAYPGRFREFSKTHYRIWFGFLGDVGDREWEMAVAYAVRNRSVAPTIAELRKVATGGLGGLDEEEAWGLVVEAVRKVGRYGVPEFEDEALTRAVRAVGWDAICDCGVDGLSAIRAHFYRTYEAMKKRGDVEREMKVLEAPELKKLIPFEVASD